MLPRDTAFGFHLFSFHIWNGCCNILQCVGLLVLLIDVYTSRLCLPYLQHRLLLAFTNTEIDVGLFAPCLRLQKDAFLHVFLISLRINNDYFLQTTSDRRSLQFSRSVFTARDWINFEVSFDLISCFSVWFPMIFYIKYFKHFQYIMIT
jgi:hypothetical protein